MEDEFVPDELRALTRVQLSEPVVGESLDPLVIWAVGGGFLLLVLIMLVFMLMRRWILNRREATALAHIERYQLYLAEFTAISLADLFEAEEVKTDNIYRLSRQDLQNNARRRLLAEEIYQLHLNLEGAQATALKTLYLGLSLYDDTKKNLKSSSEEVVIQAMREVKAYQLLDLLPTVAGLLQSKKESIQEEALLVCLELKPNELGVIESITSPLTDWQKHKILFCLQQNGNLTEDFLKTLRDSHSIHCTFYQELQSIMFPSPVEYMKMINNMELA